MKREEEIWRKEKFKIQGMRGFWKETRNRAESQGGEVFLGIKIAP